ncbi:hypothetical protein ABT294_46445 [Nonomuraea sp. NPDC000554]|uniref:hypothetical protein n=1 Tax=Nonomuraea sp. NPDC000554 TaxID=3154259 RepID=UPI003321235F
MTSRVVIRITYLTANRNTPLPQGVAAECHNFDRSIATGTHPNTDSARTSHTALTHAAENGANTGTLLAYSGHASVASLARYTRVSPDALTRWQARRDPHRRG